MLFEMLDCFNLSFDALKLIIFVYLVDTEPAWDGGRVYIDVIEKERPAEG